MAQPTIPKQAHPTLTRGSKPLEFELVTKTTCPTCRKAPLGVISGVQVERAPDPALEFGRVLHVEKISTGINVHCTACEHLEQGRAAWLDTSNLNDIRYRRGT